jgi:hypothetical protein
LEDIKLRVVDNLGEDMHDYNLWDSRKRSLVDKPYISETQPMGNSSGFRQPNDIRQAVEATLRDTLRLSNVQVQMVPSNDSDNTVDIEIADSRKQAMQRYKADPTFAEMI